MVWNFVILPSLQYKKLQYYVFAEFITIENWYSTAKGKLFL